MTLPFVLNMDASSCFDVATAFSRYRERLLVVIRKNFREQLAQRFTPEDVIQEAYLAAGKRPEFFTQAPEVPIYFKLRRISLQTLMDLCRGHLLAARRSMANEISGESADEVLSDLPSEAPSPRTLLARKERDALIKQAIDSLNEIDRQILILRNFDDMGNGECAQVLSITEKAASIRYVRALKRLREKLLTYSEFKDATGRNA